MLRKFRIWNSDENRYEEGVFLCSSDGDLYFSAEVERCGDISALTKFHPVHFHYVKEVSTTIQDSKGCEIYAGDIICYDDTPYNAYASKLIGEVIEDIAGFAVKKIKQEYSWDSEPYSFDRLLRNDRFFHRKTKIIGNIHVNYL